MSVYSGKCDLYDSLVMIHGYEEEVLKNNVIIYVGDSKEPLKINSSKDLIPYYPYLISMSYHDNIEKKCVVYTTSESFVDIEEREILEFKLKEILRFYNRCKRKKVDFNIEDCIKEVCYSNWNKEIYIELIHRVAKQGKKATIDGLHLRMHEIYREYLVKEMNNNGLNPIDYGYERFCGVL